ncbi:hypothetical protein [Bacillus massiliigorillae]|uniref:hypothetical protein n=1 Tax=Bacillus massiliigorillae TaxID=1243664 RepID=UPI0003A7C208|nr:hypothetical protein [Bacillus massiliigorillae]
MNSNIVKISLSFLLGVLLTLLIVLGSISLQKKVFTQEVESLMNLDLDLFSNNFSDYTITFDTTSIKLNLSLTENFLNLTVGKQFIAFSHFYNWLRFNLVTKYEYISRSLLSKNIQFEGTMNEHIFLYEEHQFDNNFFSANNGVLKINDKSYTYKSIKNLESNIEIFQAPNQHNRTSNGYLETDILEFMNNFFKLITKNSKDIQSNDFNLAREAAATKFDMTKEEIDIIFLRWFFFLKEVNL